MIRTNSIFLVLVAVLLSPMVANAGLITIGGAELVDPDRFENFDGVSPVTGVSNEFAGNGLNFVTLSGAGIQLTNDTGCFNLGVSGGYLYQGITGGCSYSLLQDSVSMQFDTDVSELSWTGFNRAAVLGFNIEALLNGTVVSSLIFDVSNTFEEGTVLFTGSVFNEIRFSERVDGQQQFFALDNMKWNIADVADVSEPSSLVLLVLGLLGIAARRKQRI